METEGKAAWLSEGDRNTAFFMRKPHIGEKINHIDRIRDETGCWCDKPASIQGVIQRYFHTIFTSARPTREELNEVIETVPTRVTSEMNRKLLEDYSAEEFGFVKPERGIRQGDPLSPYLFILCAEGFSCLLQTKEHDGDIRGVAVARRAPKVSHLLFADDTLIFCQATKEAMRCIRGILEKYERASGQIQPIIYLEKHPCSTIYYLQGIRWRVGDGQSIRVWSDPWLPRPSTFLPITTRSLFLPDLRVSDLLDSENGRWHKELIEGLFCPEDATLIQSIPLGQFNWADTMVWHYNKNGKFSVKSASHLAQSIALENPSPLDGQCSTSSSNWQFIWSTKVPNKIKVFLWRLCREAIPTTSNLLRRRCVVEQACLTCGVDTETTKHVFLECSYARQVRKSLDDAQFNWFAILCWRLWGRRNGLVMEKKRYNPFYCITYASSLLSDFLNSVAVKPSVLPSRNVLAAT
ncbi:UNVERIFIED_CONTAM: putative mitochondrial protein [Sesamum angustifolium]|uniref:Mitochondrial protein n=1 Tax=Sesamum angustifolium TaxID=2727405 RepID=A0AAW2PTI0_9LAMI